MTIDSQEAELLPTKYFAEVIQSSHLTVSAELLPLEDLLSIDDYIQILLFIALGGHR